MKKLINNLKFAWSYSKSEKKSLIIFVICEIISILISIVIPIIMANVIVSFTGNKLLQVILLMTGIYLIENIRNLIYFFSNKCMQVIYRETMIRIQYDLGREMLKLSNKTLDNEGSGVFIQRLNNDTSAMSDVFAYMIQILSDVIANVGVFIAVFIINKIMFVFLVIMIVVIYIIEKIRTTKRNELDKAFREKSEGVSGFISEMVRGARDIKMLNSEESFLSAMRNKIFEQNSSRYHMQNINRKYTLLRGTIHDFFDYIMIVLLVYLVSIDSLTIASAIIIFNYSGRVSSLIYCFGGLLERSKEFNLSTDRIREILEGKTFEKEHFGTKHLDSVNGDFEFRGVKFSYTDKKHTILSDLSFKVNANETVAFVGKSGVGKSTIFSLLCKLYEINDGEILIDGVNINDLDKDSIRGNITIISQNPYIFNLSIKENLRLVKNDVTDKEIKKACRIACLDDFIEKLPDKYDTIIGEGGVNLSGGQRQRLAIARALVQKTEIILFDEATSALDNETQFKIQEAIHNMKGEYTILIIAHRLSTVVGADRIMLVDDGKIVATGTHKELLKNNRLYKHLYENEMTK